MSSRVVQSGIDFSKLVILESLPEGDRKTGRNLVDNLRLELINRGDAMPVEYRPVNTPQQFARELELLHREAAGGRTPMVHIECHGNKETGLWFADGRNITWDALALHLLRINIASRFNLLVSVSACFGAYFTSMMTALRAAPCWGLVGPDDEALPPELEKGFEEFYRQLIATWNLETAIAAMQAVPLTQGNWYSIIAEKFFGQLLVHYVQEHCTATETEVRIQEIRKQAEGRGMPWLPAADIRRELRKLNAAALDKYFDIYFSVEEIPGNAERFAAFRDAMRQLLGELAATGNYVL